MSTRSTFRRGGAHAAVALAALIVLALGATVVVMPAGRDQAIFALVGEMMKAGGHPYADAFDFKPPGVHVVYAIAALTGHAMVTAHLLEVLGIALAAFLLYRLIAPRDALAAAVAAVHLPAAYLGSLRYWDLAQPEGFAVPLVVGALLAFRRAERRASAGVLAGLLIGAAGVLKYPALLFAALLPLVRPAQGHDARDGLVDVPTDTAPRRRALILAVAGVVLPLVITALWLGVTRSLGAFVSIQTEYVPGYTRLATLGGVGRFVEASWDITRSFFAERPLLLWPPAIGLALGVVWRRDALPLPLAGALLAFVGAASQGKFFHYHWIPILPFLAWLSGIGVSVLAERLPRPRERRAALGLLLTLYAVALVVSVRPVAPEKLAALGLLTGRLDAETFHRSPAFGVRGQGDHSLAGTLEAAAEVRRLSAPGDRLFVWGFEPLLYLASERTPASRFIYTAAFISPWCPASWSDELVRTLTGDPPEIVVVSSLDAIPWVTGVPFDSRQALARYPGIVELLRARYEIASQVERFTVFSRTPRASM